MADIIQWLNEQETLEVAIRIIANFLMAIPIARGGWQFRKAAKITNSPFAIGGWRMSVAINAYNLVAGLVFMYTVYTGEFEIFGLNVGWYYTLANLAFNTAPYQFYTDANRLAELQKMQQE